MMDMKVFKNEYIIEVVEVLTSVRLNSIAFFAQWNIIASSPSI